MALDAVRRGRAPAVAKGVNSFKKGLADDYEAKPAPTVQRTIENRVGVDANDVHKVG